MIYYKVCEWQGNFYVRTETEHTTTVYMDYVHSTWYTEEEAYAEVNALQEAYDNDPSNWEEQCQLTYNGSLILLAQAQALLSFYLRSYTIWGFFMTIKIGPNLKEAQRIFELRKALNDGNDYIICINADDFCYYVTQKKFIPKLSNQKVKS